MSMSRRRFMTLVGAVSAATGLAPSVVAHALLEDPALAAASGLTTLSRTLRAGNVLRSGTVTDYRAITDGPGEPHLLRTDLADPASPRTGPRRSLVHFVHLTDQHVTDAQSPLRLPFVRALERECTTSDLPAKSAHRHHELAGAHIMDAMNAKARAISFSPVTGAPLQAAITTGDNIDNAQHNELDLHIGVMNGGPVDPDSGGDGYEGVQRSGDLAYWHPDSDVGDVMKVAHGYPVESSFIDSAIAPFDAVGIGVPWYTCYGNHDALVQGNFPLDRNGLLDDQLVSDRLLTGFPEVPEGTDTCSLLGLMAGVADLGGIDALLSQAPSVEVTADPTRTFADRRDWVRAHLQSTGLPNGHGLTADNLGDTEASSRLYYTVDVGDTRWIVLDTTNPGGLSNGSMGQIQLDWLDAELTRADQEEKLVLLFSHHGLRSLNNGINIRVLLQDDYDAVTVDPQRRLAAQVEAVVERHPSVIAWFNGHSHQNTVQARETFWDIGTAAHIDWPGQSRLAEVIDNGDGTLSIVCTIIDHAGADEGHPLADKARELMMNDPLGGWHGTSQNNQFGSGTGRESDRNVELLITHPFPGTTDPFPVDRPTERASSRRVSPPMAAAGLGAGPFSSKLSIAGALTVGAAVGMKRLRDRVPQAEGADTGS
jgi:metallophosphoesterase (TIGR03767 family)